MNGRRIIYFPLEPYEQRYTAQLSAPRTGWFESKWIEHNIPYIRIEGEPTTGVIRTGVVLDSIGRNKWALSQIQNFIKMFEDEKINENDVVYVDDFFHPGLESLAYIKHFNPGRMPKVYSYLWAQSFDIHDFTYTMGDWMRNIERSYLDIYAGVFVANSLLQEMIEIRTNVLNKVHVVGLPFDSVQVRRMMTPQMKKPQVVFSSRWDAEKRPDLFCDIAERYSELYPESLVKFIVTSSSENLIKGHNFLDYTLSKFEKLPNTQVKKAQTKQEYYNTLSESAIQMNTSLQDWVSFTLLEAVCAGCGVIYPNHRSFPETFKKVPINNNYAMLTNIEDINRVCYNIHTMLHFPIDAFAKDWAIHNIVETHDRTWMRIAHIMGVLPLKLSGTVRSPVY